MMSATISDTYIKTRIITANPLELVIIAYEGAIRATESAKLYMLEERYEEKERAILKAQYIINELHSSLNIEAGEISKVLASLYNYMIRRILYADLNRDAGVLDEIIKMLKELKDTWETIQTEVVRYQSSHFKSQARPRKTASVMA